MDPDLSAHGGHTPWQPVAVRWWARACWGGALVFVPTHALSWWYCSPWCAKHWLAHPLGNAAWLPGLVLALAVPLLALGLPKVLSACGSPLQPHPHSRRLEWTVALIFGMYWLMAGAFVFRLYDPVGAAQVGRFHARRPPQPPPLDPAAITVTSLLLNYQPDVVGLVQLNLKRYCRRHGYRFLAHDDVFVSPDFLAWNAALLRRPHMHQWEGRGQQHWKYAWAKLPLIYEILHRAVQAGRQNAVVVFFDADAVVMNHDIAVHDLLMPDPDILVGHDANSNNGFNSGVQVLRANGRVLAGLERAWNSTRWDSGGSDQDALIEAFLQWPDRTAKVQVVDMPVLNQYESGFKAGARWMHGQFVAHLYSHNTDKETRIMDYTQYALGLTSFLPLYTFFS